MRTGRICGDIWRRASMVTATPMRRVNSGKVLSFRVVFLKIAGNRKRKDKIAVSIGS